MDRYNLSAEETRTGGVLRGEAPGAQLVRVARRLAAVVARDPVAATATVFLVMLVAAAVLAPLVAPYDPLAIDLRARMQGPSAGHWFGTDPVGRDVFSRLVYGARTTLRVAVLSVLLGTVLGTAAGLVSGYIGGKLDIILQRAVDVMLAFPPLIMATLVVTIFGRGETQTLAPLSVILLPRIVRVVRGSVLSVKQADYVLAVHVLGAGPGRILVWHVLPNILAPVFVLSSLAVGGVILAEASLSFLGLGTQPPNPSWGLMLATDGRKYLAEAPHLVVFPALVISLTVLALNILGDSLRDALDPKLRGWR